VLTRFNATLETPGDGDVAGVGVKRANGPPPSDTAPHTVGITSLGAGSTVAGTIMGSASASDNVGVVGGKFNLDGANEKTGPLTK